ncbi:MAG: long chain fatty acid transport protein, partial [Candidatus Zixiibacteriota bacterium]
MTTVMAVPVFAGGFFVPEQGTKAVGMANAFTAVADDVSANWYNPAGLAFQGTSVMVSGDVLLPKNDYVSGGTTYSARKKTFVIPQLYGNYALPGKPITIGIGINAPFGLSTDWTSSNAPFSRVTAGADSVTFSQIEAIQSNLNLTYRISDHLAIAAGGVYYNATKVHLDNALLEIKGDGDGFGGNAALIYRDGPFSFGVNYRSRVKINISGLVTG